MSKGANKRASGKGGIPFLLVILPERVLSPKPNGIRSVSQIMKRNLKHMIILVASGLLLAGCCTARHSTEWEYKVIHAPSSVSPKLYEMRARKGARQTLVRHPQTLGWSP